MNIVCDESTLITFFLDDSAFYNIILSQKASFFATKKSLDFIFANQHDIMLKTEMTYQGFEKRLKDLNTHIVFVKEKDFLPQIKQYTAYIEQFPQQYRKFLVKSTESLALAYSLNSPLWSLDKKISFIEEPVVLSTEKIIDLLSDLGDIDD